MKKIILVFIFFLITSSLIFSSSLKFDFKNDFVQIRFQKISIQNISKNRINKTITLETYSKLKVDYKIIDYKLIKTVRIYDNKIKIRLRKNRNYILNNKSLIIFYDFPQNGVVIEEVAGIKNKPVLKAQKSTEVLLGTYLKITKQSNSFYHVVIPDQNNYKGWIEKRKVSLLTRHNIKKEYNHVLDQKWVYLKSKQGKIKISAGTKYKILKENANRLLIEVPTGLKGWIIKRNMFSSIQGGISNIRKQLIKTAKNFLGVPYKWGGTSYKGLDCSGFIYLVYKINGISIPRDARPQYQFSKSINLQNLKKGDLIFFQTYKRGPSHVGIYLGNKKFIHASSEKGVTISHLNQEYYSSRFYGTGRIIK